MCSELFLVLSESCFGRSRWFWWRDLQQLVWPNHCSHTGKWLPLSPFCTFLHHLYAAGGLASCRMTNKRTQGCPWWWHRCHVMPWHRGAVTAKQPVCDRPTTLLFSRPLNVYPSPKFPPVAPWFSPDWNLLSPTSHRPQCQDDHTLCSRNPHTNHSLMQTVPYIVALGTCHLK